MSLNLTNNVGSVLGPMCFISTLVNVSVIAERTIAKVKLQNMDIEIYLVAFADNVSALLVARRGRDPPGVVNCSKSCPL